MKKLLTSVSVCAIIMAAAFTIQMVLPQQASAVGTVVAQADDENQSDQESTTAVEQYTYIAQPGDSYTKMARKAVQTYGIETSSEIGKAGVLFAETNLTSLAGWPPLNEGQTVTISKTDVKEWFDKAAKLSAEEKANWEYYVPFVDFNTNHVGEAPKN